MKPCATCGKKLDGPMDENHVKIAPDPKGDYRKPWVVICNECFRKTISGHKPVEAKEE